MTAATIRAENMAIIALNSFFTGKVNITNSLNANWQAEVCYAV